MEQPAEDYKVFRSFNTILLSVSVFVDVNNFAPGRL